GRSRNTKAPGRPESPPRRRPWPTNPRPSDDATRPNPVAPRAGGLFPRPDGLPDPPGLPGDRLAELLGARRRPEPAPGRALGAVRADEPVHLGQHALLDRAAGGRARPDHAADRRGTAGSAAP